MLTVVEKINIGKTSAYLVAEELDGGKRHGGSLDEKQRILLRIVADTIETQYNANPTDTTLEKTSNYLMRLSKHKDKALEDIASGGSGSVADPTSSSFPNPYDFQVSTDSFILSGDTSKQFPSSWIGFNILFVRGHQTQSLVDEGSTYYLWSRTTAILTLLGPAPYNGAAQEDEIFQIYPV